MSAPDPADTIPIFPLPSVVLFPSQSVPLYIFEPRYRQMTADVLDADRRIGMVAVRPDHLGEMAGDPPIFEVGCEGLISQAEQRPDGSYMILLQATQRFRISAECERQAEQLYRRAQVQGLADPFPDTAREHVKLMRNEVLDQLRDLLRRAAEADSPAPALERLEAIDDTRFVNALCQAIELAPLEKQQLLEAPGVPERYATLSDLMGFRLAELDARGGPGPSALQ
jgi:Lon protease-like protein